jgi:hypothetical protein
MLYSRSHERFDDTSRGLVEEYGAGFEQCVFDEKVNNSATAKINWNLKQDITRETHSFTSHLDIRHCRCEEIGYMEARMEQAPGDV